MALCFSTIGITFIKFIITFQVGMRPIGTKHLLAHWYHRHCVSYSCSNPSIINRKLDLGPFQIINILGSKKMELFILQYIQMQYISTREISFFARWGKALSIVVEGKIQEYQKMLLDYCSSATYSCLWVKTNGLAYYLERVVEEELIL